MNESKQTIQSLLAQLPDERLPNEWLFSIELGYWIILAVVIIISLITYFSLKKAKFTKSRKLKLDVWLHIVGNKELTDKLRIEQANSLIKLNLSTVDVKSSNTLSGSKWHEFLQNKFTGIHPDTFNLLANAHYQANCKINNLTQFNQDIQTILKECIYV
ncbi:MAG: DUF4381 family protein [Saccharospirillaceae bacterium]|nr:DUF4381 domain-containing protein [Pseudomonadales bacterium]NRB78256.1 DUF4381 family protein [Saccharospirillaceae bacterium]